ncbi:hypothetical protein [Nostoc sp. 'Peltigera membranacea cyanobiont' 232]|uniref:hypothetical protein n=1 Tax=Nostoc sp. 'Peltigera membranacea cyanobiont' 232 TaxID=2014531 RepID=UPI000B957892|nr:hypothetical protein [Nostoc sp. 'Peltigera membranacea cyanobiont' 232]OYE00159.1 hypothetical protein CDG79_36720 [Nostoc sp. 'Peltigera membranacea cyanobiont' 232]
MTYPKYTQQALSRYTVPRLKRIAAEHGVTPTGDKRATETWVDAIISHQSAQFQKVANEQALAQAELDNYITDQAQAIAPEPFTIVEISFDHHEYYAGNQLVASISHDNNHLTQPWVVMVNEKEVFRANTPMRCDRFICTHYKDGSLPVQKEAEVQGSRGAEGKNLQQLSPLPLCASAPMPSSSTENQIMAHIFNECQNYGFEILDDGIYNNKGVKLGQVGCTDGNWWVKRRYSVQQQYSNSVLDAVRRLCPSQTSLSMVDVSTDGKSIFDEYFLDQPLEQLTGDKLQRLLERAELVTA